MRAFVVIIDANKEQKVKVPGDQLQILSQYLGQGYKLEICLTCMF